MKFEHLRTSATECFADAVQVRNADPESAMSLTASGHEVLASYYLAVGDGRSTEEILALLQIELERYRLYGVTVRSFPQHSYLLLALAINDLGLARSIAALPIARRDWAPFDAHVTNCICIILKIADEGSTPRISPTASEALFIKALNAVLGGFDFDSGEVNAFWKSVRTKRYRYTIFEHRNLFEAALRTLQRVER